MLNMAPLGGGIFLGWSLGANDAANVFGTAVASRIVTFRKAALLCSMSLLLGAILQGSAGIDTYARLLGSNNMTVLVIASVAAAVTVSLMTYFNLPVSTSQAIVGAIVGIGLATGNVQWPLLTRVVICWLATPVGAMLIACVVYKVLGWFIGHVPMSILTRDKILWGGLLVVGVYGSYALGANNVANATGIFSGQFSGITDRDLTMIGGIAISLGVLSYSKRIMHAVGSGIMPLDAFTSLVAVLAMSATVHIFAVVGVPVSTSQGIVGAIIGIGLVRGIDSLHFRPLRNIGLGWLLTPTIALILSAAGYAIFVGGA